MMIMILNCVLPNTDFLYRWTFKERRIRKFALIVVDCFHKEYIYIIEFYSLIAYSTSSIVPNFIFCTICLLFPNFEYCHDAVEVDLTPANDFVHT